MLIKNIRLDIWIEEVKVGVGQYQKVCILSVEIIEITQMIVELGDILVKRLFGEERNIYGCPGNQVNGHLQIGLENKLIKCGYTTIIGKTNVGKSTFLNKFLDKKVSITADKSQTTRSNIYAIKTMERTQIIFIDTPGIHKKSEKTLNKVLRKKPSEVIHDVDVIIFMVSGTKFDDVDQETLELVYQSSAKKILVINKIDLVKNKKTLFSFVEETFKKDDFLPLFLFQPKIILESIL